MDPTSNNRISAGSTQITAQNDPGFHDAPTNREAIQFQELTFQDGVTTQDLISALTSGRRDDGRDQILVRFQQPGANGNERIGLISADELNNLDKLEVGGPININGERATVLAIDDEDEDGWATKKDILINAFAFLVDGTLGGVMLLTPDPTVVLLKVGGVAMLGMAAAHGAEVLNAAETLNLDAKPSSLLDGLALPKSPKR